MLADIIGPGRLREGDPQALATLVAVAGWPVVSYCERAGAQDDVARAVVLTFVTFRRRAIAAGEEAGPDLERILAQSARDAVDELRGDAPSSDAARAAEEAFARARPRPLSARLATHVLAALVDAAPVAGERPAVRTAAERSYADAYSAAEPAPAVPGEDGLGPPSALLARAAARDAPDPPAAPDARTPAPPSRPQAHRGEPRAAEPAAKPVSPDAARAPAGSLGGAAAATLAGLLARGRVVQLAAAAGALLLLAFIVVLAGGGDRERSTTPATTPAVTVTVTRQAPGATSAGQIVRGTPRTPLTASGARFEVVPITKAGWARRIRARAPRAGYRWATIAVRTRNISRRDLSLRALNYRLRTSAGIIVGPLVVELERAPPGPLPVGRRASVHLGFEVATGAGQLSFAFEPGGLEQPTVVVTLPTSPS